MVKQEESPSRGGYAQANTRNGGSSNSSTTSTSSRAKAGTGTSQMADSYSMMYHSSPYEPQHSLSHPNNGSALTPYNSTNGDHLLNNSYSSSSNSNTTANFEHGNHDKSTNNTATLEGGNNEGKYPADANTNSNAPHNSNGTSNGNNTNSSGNTTQTPVTTVTSPRLVIETNTNVDSLDDGYHWRKYGQKTVKGSPFPRSYYKCTEKGCSVKKQVEQNGTSIVNTYEGTHTHLAPAFDDSSELSKKRRLRRSEGQDSSNPAFKRMHKSLDGVDIKTSQSPDTAQNSQFHTPMPIGSMGSILQHTSHLQAINYLPPTLALTPQPAPASVYSNQPDSNNFALSGPKLRTDPTPALAPLHSFSHTTLSSSASSTSQAQNGSTNTPES